MGEKKHYFSKDRKKENKTNLQQPNLGKVYLELRGRFPYIKSKPQKKFSIRIYLWCLFYVRFG